MCGAMSLGHGWMGYGLGSIVVWGIFLAVVAALVYVLLRAGRGHGHGHNLYDGGGVRLSH